MSSTPRSTRSTRKTTSTSTDPAAGAALREALDGLTARPRVHELARRAQMSSKEIISALADRGVTVASASSGVDLADATDLLTSLLGDPESSAPAESVGSITPAHALPVADRPLFLPPEAVAPPRRRRTKTVPQTGEPDGAADRPPPLGPPPLGPPPLGPPSQGRIRNPGRTPTAAIPRVARRRDRAAAEAVGAAPPTPSRSPSPNRPRSTPVTPPSRPTNPPPTPTTGSTTNRPPRPVRARRASGADEDVAAGAGSPTTSRATTTATRRLRPPGRQPARPMTQTEPPGRNRPRTPTRTPRAILTPSPTVTRTRAPGAVVVAVVARVGPATPAMPRAVTTRTTRSSTSGSRGESHRPMRCRAFAARPGSRPSGSADGTAAAPPAVRPSSPRPSSWPAGRRSTG